MLRCSNDLHSVKLKRFQLCHIKWSGSLCSNFSTREDVYILVIATKGLFLGLDRNLSTIRLVVVLWLIQPFISINKQKVRPFSEFSISKGLGVLPTQVQLALLLVRSFQFFLFVALKGINSIATYLFIRFFLQSPDKCICRGLWCFIHLPHGKQSQERAVHR